MMALLLAAAAASATSHKQKLPPGPVDFTADQMRMEPHDHRAILDGDVHLAQGDLTVTGDHAVVELAQQAPQQPAPAKRGQKKKKPLPKASALGDQSLQRFTVDGNVHVQRGDRTADGDHGVLDTPAQTLLLTGTPEVPPVLKDGSETLSGERILLHLDSDDVEVSRPRLVLRKSVPVDSSLPKATPVRVEALNLVLDQAKHVARFNDEVVIHRGDTTVRSPRMNALYDDAGQLTKLEMRGGVDLRQGLRHATSQSADYDAATREVKLTGDPHLYDRGDVLAGDTIDLALDSREVRVEKAKGRLRPENHQRETAGARP
jgi:lipopolysaccharide transport protein LptA